MKINVTARACVVCQEKLFLVTNDESYWYLPGGHQLPGESLTQCAEREIFEESGHIIKCGDVIYCSEFIDNKIGSHKVEIIFVASLLNINDKDDWKDVDCSVSKSAFFSVNEMKDLNVQPRYLKEGKWLSIVNSVPIYKGLEMSK